MTYAAYHYLEDGTMESVGGFDDARAANTHGERWGQEHDYYVETPEADITTLLGRARTAEEIRLGLELPGKVGR